MQDYMINLLIKAVAKQTGRQTSKRVYLPLQDVCISSKSDLISNNPDCVSGVFSHPCPLYLTSTTHHEKLSKPIKQPLILARHDVQFLICSSFWSCRSISRHTLQSLPGRELLNMFMAGWWDEVDYWKDFLRLQEAIAFLTMIIEHNRQEDFQIFF